MKHFYIVFISFWSFFIISPQISKAQLTIPNIKSKSSGSSSTPPSEKTPSSKHSYSNSTDISKILQRYTFLQHKSDFDINRQFSCKYKDFIEINGVEVPKTILTVSSNGQVILVQATSTNKYLINTKTKNLCILKDSSDKYFFSKNSHYLFAQSSNGISVYDVSYIHKSKQCKTRSSFKGNITSFVVSSSGQEATYIKDGAVYFWKVSSRKHRKLFSSADSVAISSSGKFIAFLKSHMLYVVSPSGKVITKIDNVRTFVFNPVFDGVYVLKTFNEVEYYQGNLFKNKKYIMHDVFYKNSSIIATGLYVVSTHYIPYDLKQHTSNNDDFVMFVVMSGDTVYYDDSKNKYQFKVKRLTNIYYITPSNPKVFIVENQKGLLRLFVLNGNSSYFGNPIQDTIHSVKIKLHTSYVKYVIDTFYNEKTKKIFKKQCTYIKKNKIYKKYISKAFNKNYHNRENFGNQDLYWYLWKDYFHNAKLYKTNINDEGSMFLKGKTLISIDARQSRITGKSIRNLALANPLKLNLTSIILKDRDLKYLNNNLRVLILRDTRTSNIGVKYLTKAVPNLVSLDLRNTRIKGKVVNYLSKFQYMSELYLDYTNLKNRDIRRWIGKLSHKQKQYMVILSLSHTKISTRILNTIKNSFKNLKKLYIGGNNISISNRIFKNWNCEIYFY